MTKHNTKLILALDEIPADMQAKIRAAMKRPSPFGAFIGSQAKVKTSLGYAVHSGFVTGLGAEMIRAADAPAGETAPKKKRAKAVAP